MICIRIYPNQLPRSARRRSTLALAVIASLNVLIDRVAILLACTSCSSLIDTVASLAVRLGMNRRFRGWNSKPLAVSCLVALLVSLAFLVRQRTRCQQQSSGDGTSIGYTGYARSGNAGKRQRVLHFRVTGPTQYTRAAIGTQRHDGPSSDRGFTGRS